MTYQQPATDGIYTKPTSSPALAPGSVRRAPWDLPPFSSMPLLLLVVLKPVADALYEVEAVKYGYILLLFVASLFARAGQAFQRAEVDPRNGCFLPFIWLIVAYFCFHFGLLLVYRGNLAEIFKIVSPFVFFILVAYAADRWLMHALALGAILTIVGNAAILPFDYGWVDWGTIRTFKGFYYFKTDLAYALCFSIVICSLYSRNKVTVPLMALVFLSAIQVVLANSRLNYLSFALVLIFLAVKQGFSLASIARYGLLVGIVAVTVLWTYDPTKLLGFESDDLRAFTQGRNTTWERLLSSLLNYSPIEWLFGKGPFADLFLSLEAVRGSQAANNAHNEALHLIYTQGIFGTLFYVLLWVQVFRMSRGSNLPPWARGTAMLALTLFLLQGLTAVLSSFATKTWPLVMVLLAMRGLSRPPPPEAKQGTA